MCNYSYLSLQLSYTVLARLSQCPDHHRPSQGMHGWTMHPTTVDKQNLRIIHVTFGLMCAC